MGSVGVKRPTTRVGVKGPMVRTGIQRPELERVSVRRDVQRVTVKGPGYVNGIRTGTEGPPGPEGPPGIPASGAYYAEVNFASAATTWTIPLPVGVSSYATNIDTLTSGGDVIRGQVSRPDASTIQVDWFYPTAGIARVYR